ncbi:MAG: hypothetical protein HC796_06845, partial [Synechococcaceae cyanobacterium RL_1_2]|nr:hypothetical protein [Synechococcaceae cyanobacterium RL_1_2]
QSEDPSSSAADNIRQDISEDLSYLEAGLTRGRKKNILNERKAPLSEEQGIIAKIEEIDDQVFIDNAPTNTIDEEEWEQDDSGILALSQEEEENTAQFRQQAAFFSNPVLEEDSQEPLSAVEEESLDGDAAPALGNEEPQVSSSLLNDSGEEEVDLLTDDIPSEGAVSMLDVIDILNAEEEDDYSEELSLDEEIDRVDDPLGGVVDLVGETDGPFDEEELSIEEEISGFSDLSPGEEESESSSWSEATPAQMESWEQDAIAEALTSEDLEAANSANPIDNDIFLSEGSIPTRPMEEEEGDPFGLGVNPESLNDDFEDLEDLDAMDSTADPFDQFVLGDGEADLSDRDLNFGESETFGLAGLRAAEDELFPENEFSLDDFSSGLGDESMDGDEMAMEDLGDISSEDLFDLDHGNDAEAAIEDRLDQDLIAPGDGVKNEDLSLEQNFDGLDELNFEDEDLSGGLNLELIADDEDNFAREGLPDLFSPKTSEDQSLGMAPDDDFNDQELMDLGLEEVPFDDNAPQLDQELLGANDKDSLGENEIDDFDGLNFNFGEDSIDSADLAMATEQDDDLDFNLDSLGDGEDLSELSFELGTAPKLASEETEVDNVDNLDLGDGELDFVVDNVVDRFDIDGAQTAEERVGETIEEPQPLTPTAEEGLLLSGEKSEDLDLGPQIMDLEDLDLSRGNALGDAMDTSDSISAGEDLDLEGLDLTFDDLGEESQEKGFDFAQDDISGLDGFNFGDDDDESFQVGGDEAGDDLAAEIGLDLEEGINAIEQTSGAGELGLDDGTDIDGETLGGFPR